MSHEKIKAIQESKVLPLCLTKAKIQTTNVWIYGAPVPAVMTKQYRIVKYYKPVSTVISLKSVTDGKK